MGLYIAILQLTEGGASSVIGQLVVPRACHNHLPNHDTEIVIVHAHKMVGNRAQVIPYTLFTTLPVRRR